MNFLTSRSITIFLTSILQKLYVAALVDCTSTMHSGEIAYQNQYIATTQNNSSQLTKHQMTIPTKLKQKVQQHKTAYHFVKANAT